MKKALALDLDELMYPFLDNLIGFANARLGQELVKGDFYTYRFEEVWGGSPSESANIVNDFFFQLDRHPEPIAGSIEAVDRLSAMFELYVVTARHDELEDMTMQWLKEHFPDVFAGVHLCNLYGENRVEKSEICRRVQAVALVDDSLANVTSVALDGRKGILFGEFPWNGAEHLPDGVVRARTWDEVITEVKGLQ